MVVNIVAILLFLWGGQVKLEQYPYRTQSECEEAIQKRIQEIEKDPQYDGGFGAWCVPLRDLKAAENQR